MKRVLFLSLAFLIIIGGLTGCNNKKENKTKNGIAFTITCTEDEEKGEGYKMQNITTYSFGEDQYIKEYTVVTDQKYSKKETYETYKTAQEKVTKDESNENVSYTLKYDDKKMTLLFTTIVKNIDKATLSDEEKEESKAKNIFEAMDSQEGITCELEGIKKSKLK